MVRRTKEQAQATRTLILDTAELVFEQRGVSGTTLGEIAKSAGLTRGAIYWHFDGKSDLFTAMMERVTLPLEEVEAAQPFKGPDMTLTQMRAKFLDLLRNLTTDAQLARVFEIATHKVEYVGEMSAVRAHRLSMRNGCVADMERALRRSVRSGDLPKGLHAHSAAIGMVALFDGLLQNWMLDRGGFDLTRVGARVFDAYVRGLATPAQGDLATSGRRVI